MGKIIGTCKNCDRPGLKVESWERGFCGTCIAVSAKHPDPGKKKIALAEAKERLQAKGVQVRGKGAAGKKTLAAAIPKKSSTRRRKPVGKSESPAKLIRKGLRSSRVAQYDVYVQDCQDRGVAWLNQVEYFKEREQALGNPAPAKRAAGKGRAKNASAPSEQAELMTMSGRGVLLRFTSPADIFLFERISDRALQNENDMATEILSACVSEYLREVSA